MKRQTVNFLTAVALSLGLSSGADAALLTFDDVPGGSVQGTFGNMPDYQGFSFSFTLDWIDVEGSTSWPFGAKSGDFAILNNLSGVGTVTAVGGGTFTFDGLWAKRWATAPESGGTADLFGTLEGWLGGVEAWSLRTALNGSYQYFGAQAGPIDELRLGFGNNFLVDDLALNGGGQPAPVPVPAAGVLLLSGLAAVGLLRRRRAA